MMFRLRAFLATIALAMSASIAVAQTYPSKPIRLIVPFATGGGNDTVARIIAQRLSEQLGQQMIVDNRAGGNGIVGTEAVARAPADGYTLLLGFVGPLAILPGMQQVPYDPLGFAPVSMLAQAYQILVVHPSVPAKNVQEFVALAKAKPGTLNYASGGTGTPLHLVPELFKLAAGVDLVHVPYKGSNPAATAVVAGDAQVLFGGVVSTLPLAKSGRLRALAVTSPQRLPAAPDVPTLAEAGYPSVIASSWYGLLAPANTPAAVIDRLNREVRAAVTSADYREKLAAQGQDAVASTPTEMREFIRTELAKWTKVVKAANIKGE